MEKSTKIINNAFYDDLQEEWMHREDHPIALLRAENAVRNPWIAETIQKKGKKSCHILDVGCGGGLLANYLALQNHQVCGIDLSETSLAIAKRYDVTKTVEYKQASAYALPYPDGHFDVVTAMDLLEHVEDPKKVIAESARVLKKGGLFFFHTFNRNILSYLLIIKGVEWFIPHAPQNMHVYPLFIKPKELIGYCESSELSVQEMQGLRPSFGASFLLKWLKLKKLAPSLQFTFCPSLLTGYSGYAIKKEK